MNVLIFTGNLGSDAAVRQAGSSTVASFSVAMKSGYGEQATTVWLRCNLWGKRAEGGLIPYLKKGQQVAVSGELSVRTYVNKNDETVTSVEVNVSELDLIGGSKAPQHTPAPQPHGGDPFADDIPFMPIDSML